MHFYLLGEKSRGIDPQTPSVVVWLSCRLFKSIVIWKSMLKIKEPRNQKCFNILLPIHEVTIFLLIQNLRKYL